MAFCGDVATQEALAATAILQLAYTHEHGTDPEEITNRVWPL
jgi:hypothetical protein